MPFVLVPDREAELKTRIEDDEADERIARLGPAPRAAAHRDDRRAAAHARLYVNVGSPAVAALLDAHRARRRHDRALGLLRAVLALIAAGERETRAGVDLGAALAASARRSRRS